MATSTTTTVQDLRAAIARSGQYIYIIAARARINPITLSRILNGHVPLTQQTALRILSAIEEEQRRAS
jgi:plasmid maintenance system antidote protein VapI